MRTARRWAIGRLGRRAGAAAHSEAVESESIMKKGRRWRGANETNKMFGTPQDTYFGAITGGRQSVSLVEHVIRLEHAEGCGGAAVPAARGQRPQGKHRPQPRNPAARSPGTNGNVSRLFRNCLGFHYSKPKRRTRKPGTEQLARTRDTHRAKQSCTENFRRTCRTELITVATRLGLRPANPSRSNLATFCRFRRLYERHGGLRVASHGQQPCSTSPGRINSGAGAQSQLWLQYHGLHHTFACACGGE